MGCTRDTINMIVKSKEMAEKAMKLFNEVLKDELYFHFEIEEDDIREEDDCFIIEIDEEPLFLTWEGNEQVAFFVKEFILQNPKESFYLENTTSFSNCGDTNYYEYTYDEKNKELTIRTVFAEFDSLYMCPECEEDFEEALVYIEDYKKGETYTCPYCGETITFDAAECITKIKLEEFNNENVDNIINPLFVI